MDSFDIAYDAVDDVWNARVAEQSSWARPTDAERLAVAFDELNAVGILSLMNFTCCSNCSSSIH